MNAALAAMAYQDAQHHALREYEALPPVDRRGEGVDLIREERRCEGLYRRLREMAEADVAAFP